MKFLLALAALLMAATSVATAAHGVDAGARGGAVEAAHHGAPYGDGSCHNNDAGAPLAPDCGATAVCALACGVVAPSLFDAAHIVDAVLVDYSVGVAALTGADRRPEAPPPRSRFL